jgi:electron transport complex protein RnfG
MKNRLLRNILVLAGICSFFALLLGLVNMFTGPVIGENKARDEKKALAGLVRDGESTGEAKAVDGHPVVKGAIPVLAGGEPAGLILTLVIDGYGGPVTIMANYQKDGTLVKAVVVNDTETPGIGKRIEEEWYMALFAGKGGADPIPLKKSQLPAEQADSLTGATITFTAVSAALEAGSAWMKNNPEVVAP